MFFKYKKQTKIKAHLFGGKFDQTTKTIIVKNMKFPKHIVRYWWFKKYKYRIDHNSMAFDRESKIAIANYHYKEK